MLINTTVLPSTLHPDRMIRYYAPPSDPGMIYWEYVYKEDAVAEEVPVPITGKNETEANDVAAIVGGTATVGVILYLSYEGIKWFTASGLAGITGGFSLGVAVCMP